jgi:UDP-glucose 4-epimerase
LAAIRFLLLSIVAKFQLCCVICPLVTGRRFRQASRSLPATSGDTELLFRLVQNHRIDAILHFAAKVVVPESVADPLIYYLNNTVKTHTLLKAAVRGNVKHLVFSSTAAAYGDPSLTPVSETADPAPLSPYGRSKLMSEQMLADASAAYDLRHVTLR